MRQLAVFGCRNIFIFIPLQFQQIELFTHIPDGIALYFGRPRALFHIIPVVGGCDTCALIDLIHRP